MVKEPVMLISEFARTTGLSTDTVRFYVRLGLLVPETSTKGGRNPYQVFTAELVDVARIIRLAQSLGFSLKEIAALGEEHRAGQMTRQRSAEIMSQQLARLEEKAAHLNAMTAYLRAKIDWLRQEDDRPEPRFSDYGTPPAFG
ncbi:MerR family transcriptional regulator [Acidisoma cellulosilyticum]|nr:MerR family transcriptional regulator [Acidisoma cellulosilyticum]